MRKGLPLILLAAGGLYVFSQLKNFGKTLTVRIGGISFNAAKSAATGYLKAVFNVKLIVANSSNLQGIIKGGKLSLIFNNRIVGGVDRIAETTVTAGADTVVPLEATVSTLNLVSNISDLLRIVGSGQPLKFKVVGTLLTNYGTVDIAEDITVAL
jgi:hypothetical protein